MVSSARRARVAAVQDWLQRSQVPAAVVTAPVSMYYLIGWANPTKRFSGLLIPATGEPVLILPALEAQSAKAAEVVHYQTWADADDPFAVLSATAARFGIRSNVMAIEKESVTVGLSERIQSALATGTSALPPLSDLSPLLVELRSRKDESEISALQAAADLLNEALDAAMTEIRPGVTEEEIASGLDRTLRSSGSQGTAFDTHVLVGENAALPHGHAGRRVVHEGDVVLMDFGAVVDGYRSDITRTVVVGHWRPEMARIYDVVLEAHDAAIARVGPGVPRGEVDEAARKVIAKAGYGEYFTHRTGHGLGLEIHEEPYLVATDRHPLEAGHVVTIEPGIYLPGVGGVRIEDDVLVTPDGKRILTTWPTGRITLKS